MNEVFKSVYPKSIIDAIENKSIACKVDKGLFLENTHNDFNNHEFISSIFEYVKEYFNLPEFDLDIGNGGCYITPKTQNKQLINRVLTEATYGLHILADMNYK